MEKIFRSYYTKSDFITNYMVSKIEPNDCDTILEPCGGDGAFIDALLNINPNLNIETCDLNRSAVKVLRKKYKGIFNISVREADTLLDTTFDKYSINGYYQKIIGNPPYGGWQDLDKRAILKKKYNGFYVKETYTLFLLRCISLLADDGVLSFIIPDTFLFLHNHKEIRKHILSTTSIKEILIFPSKLFPGVSFGYSNLCIITLQKTRSNKTALNNTVRIIRNLQNEIDLKHVLNEQIEKFDVIFLKQDEILNSPDSAFLISQGSINETIVSCETRLGELCDCVTGIYCGDNKRFLFVDETCEKPPLGYSAINDSNVSYDCENLIGLDAPKSFIQIIKGSSKTSYYRTAPLWYIDWSFSAIRHYNTDKKARFQNSTYYFKQGIAMPMVKSSQIKATLMDKCVFDQSIVGVFPKENRYMFFVLAYLNSKIANTFMHIINPTANNSSNYVKKLPIFVPTQDELSYINSLVFNIFETHNFELYQPQIDVFFANKFNDTNL
ncbi:MAG: N-6 DNA methylase [Muribaculaceae bacterium]